MRLIDADALIEEAESGGWDVDTKELQMILKYVPTIDAVPVVRGRWRTIRGNYVTGGGNPMWGCSKCDYIYGATMMPPKYNYCPNCGAKMESEGST